MPVTTQQLRDMLVGNDFIEAASFDDAAAEAARTNQPLDEVLISRNLIPDEYLGQLVADILNYPFVRLETQSILDHILRLVPERMARGLKAVAFGRNRDGDLLLAMHDPEDLETARMVEKKSGMRVVPHYATERGIAAGIEHYTSDLASAARSILEGGEEEGEGKVIRVVELVMNYAYQNDASDIHIEPREKDVLVRYRIDGILHDAVWLPISLMDSLIRRIKILSKMRLDEHYAAQDGKFQEVIGGERVDVRVSILPVVEGEKVVMRVLAEKGKRFDLEELGLSERNMKKVRRNTKKLFGMILSCGPTGSGKTTTMYAVLKLLNTRNVNIATIEDPIEYAVEGVNQIQVNPKTGLTFASGLRSIARQDPDIIMVGEIRDEETAGIAVNAAMTGHLVLSTLHTNDAATTLPRFRDMKIEPFLIASTVNAIIAQRLARRICSRCITSYDVSREEIESQFSPEAAAKFFRRKDGRKIRLYRGAGCDRCGHTGYQGRIGVFEVLEVSDDIRDLIMADADAKSIKQAAVRNGMVTLLEDSIEKALSGITTVEEILRVAAE